MIGHVFARFVLLVLAIIATVFIYAYVVEPRIVVLEKVTVHVDSLPSSLEGFTIGVIGDLHLDSSPQESSVRAVAMLVELDPDVVAIVGDFAKDESMIERINEIVEPLNHPYGIPGNWDRWSEEPGYEHKVDIDMLVNRGVMVAPGLWLCGIDDALLGNPSIDDAVAGAPEGSIRILLAHEPDVADWVTPDQEIALQISGHSHGGQVRLPYFGALLLPPLGQKYPIGLAQSPTHAVYTTRGIGMSHIPVRFMCPPEVTLITLTAN